MAVTTLGNNTTPTVIGGDVSVTTGLAITTLPISSPITINSTGNHQDSYWNLSGNTLVPDLLTYKVGLGSVSDGLLNANHILLYDDLNNEIKKIDGTEVSLHDHVHGWGDIEIGLPTTLSGYGITDAQPLHARLTAITVLGATNGFLKKSGTSSWTVDNSTYSLSSHLHTDVYEPKLATCAVEDYILYGKPNGLHVWKAAPVTIVEGGGEGVTDHGLLDATSLTHDDHAQYALLAGRSNDVLHIDNIHEKTSSAGISFGNSFGFASTSWRFTVSGSDLIIKYDGDSMAKLSSTGDLTVIGEVTAMGTI